MNALVQLFRPGWVFILIVFLGIPAVLTAQISPGELSQAHAHLEGMSNCTKCHDLGKQVSNGKCLACHTELKARIDAGKGYHASSAIKGKDCTKCHSDHHGRGFQIVKFDTKTFDHALTGFKLLGAHTKKQCKDCHKPALIKNPDIRKKGFTYLGLDPACLGCHQDYHRRTLASSCTDCHSNDAFKPASGFNHNKAKFKLLGRHQEVDCIKCHKTEMRDGKKFQVFTGLKFSACVSCHTDVHNGLFGNDCRKCHTENSFRNAGQVPDFDHSKTGFALEGKHQQVNCRKCHTGKISDPLPHKQCTDCHQDYHEKQFMVAGKVKDCKECHTPSGFALSTFTIKQHQSTNFILTGAHVATPCFVCHKKEDKWKFRNIGKNCIDCHTDIHDPLISKKYYPENTCESCHTTQTWKTINFDHSRTSFPLKGRHQGPSCRTCHFPKDDNGKAVQRFASLGESCSQCHTDPHNAQFGPDGTVDCARCHGFDFWQIAQFNHDKTAFKLEGKHKEVSCAKCHKTLTGINNKTYIQYKFKEVSCKTCH